MEPDYFILIRQAVIGCFFKKIIMVILWVITHLAIFSVCLPLNKLVMFQNFTCIVTTLVFVSHL